MQLCIMNMRIKRSINMNERTTEVLLLGERRNLRLRSLIQSCSGLPKKKLIA